LASALGQGHEAELQCLDKKDDCGICDHSDLFLIVRFDRQGFLDEHHGYAVPDGIKKTAGSACEAVPGGRQDKVAFAFGATEDIEQILANGHSLPSFASIRGIAAIFLHGRFKNVAES
jgi:hypothetical protein